MSYIHIVCTCSCALFICACLISAHMYLAYVHIRARHRGKKFARAGRIEKCIVQFADTCIYVCRCFSSFQQFATSNIRIQPSHCVCCIDFRECLYQSFLGHHAWGCTFITIYLLLPSSAKVHQQQTSSCNPPDIHFSSRAPQQHLPRVAAIPFQRPEGVPQRVIKHDSGDQNPPSVMSHVLPS